MKAESTEGFRFRLKAIVRRTARAMRRTSFKYAPVSMREAISFKSKTTPLHPNQENNHTAKNSNIRKEKRVQGIRVYWGILLFLTLKNGGSWGRKRIGRSCSNLLHLHVLSHIAVLKNQKNRKEIVETRRRVFVLLLRL